MPNYLSEAKNEITRWEGEGPGFISKVSDFVLWPAQKAAELIIPKGVQETVGKAIENFLSGMGSVTKNTINEEDIRARVESYKGDGADFLKPMDEAAKHYWNWHIGYATGEGAATGAGGWALIAADIPALFGIAIRLIQEIAICYGYRIDTDEEREYILNILRTGSTADVKAKLEFVIALKEVEQILLKVAWKKMASDLAKKEINKRALLVALREFAKSLGIQLTKRKALQMVPVIGAAVGAAFNSTFVNDIGKAAYMSYRRRKIAEVEGEKAS